MAANFINSVDERTKLAGANRLEILLFSLGKDKQTDRQEVFGINVFKVREVMHVPEITHAPDTPPSVEGLVSLRGTMVPIVNLVNFCGVESEEPPRILIVTEYNRHTQGLLVHSVEHILRMEWNEIKVPPPMLAHRMGGLITAVTELKDGRIVMILDVEKVLEETSHLGSDPQLFDEVEEVAASKTTVLFADDSAVARKQIENTLKHLGTKYISTKNGSDAWTKLQELASRAESANVPISEYVTAVLTDVEMPEMDGYVLTKCIKSDGRFRGIPVIMHSSLSAEANVTMGKNCGADVYVAKFSPRDLAEGVRAALANLAKTESP